MGGAGFFLSVGAGSGVGVARPGAVSWEARIRRGILMISVIMGGGLIS